MNEKTRVNFEIVDFSAYTFPKQVLKKLKYKTTKKSLFKELIKLQLAIL